MLVSRGATIAKMKAVFVFLILWAWVVGVIWGLYWFVNKNADEYNAKNPHKIPSSQDKSDYEEAPCITNDHYGCEESTY